PAPLGALPNNPPQRGGLKHTPKCRPKGQCQSALHCPFRATYYWISYPPRCGGLLGVAPEEAKEKRIGSLCVT
ncbi:MAG: hypothetical protein LBC02_12440, partial [Planctomycetaceae bacterium]|nr:hypothetical protein [Planctomycetaceae bacterium]